MAASVTVDGVRYVPDTGTGRIGIGITTRNRNDTLTEALTQHRLFRPPGSVLIIVDDASAKPVDGADYRFDHQAGVASAKNKCLELLIMAGCDHLFLFDDDCWPTADGWWQPYVDSPEPHLMYVFEDLKKPPKLKDIHRIGGDAGHVAWSGPRGCMLYAHRSAVDAVGGMDTIFNPWGYEHGDWSNRIHHAGLTTWRYADVAGSADLFHSMDEWGETSRTVATADRQRLARDHATIHHRRRDGWFTGYADYHPVNDGVILTCLFTGGAASKSQRNYKPTTDLVKTLADSVQHGRMIVFHDQLQAPKLTCGNGRPVEFVKLPPPTVSVFFYRHMVAWQWLRDHPATERVWCVDGTDVVQLRDPFTGIQRGKLHIGWEPKTLADPWMIDHHREVRVSQFMANHRDRQLLNVGLVGGDRATVMEFLHGMVAYWHDVAMRKQTPDSGDMGIANLLGHGRFADRLITGTAVATVFKAWQPNDVSPWQHK